MHRHLVIVLLVGIVSVAFGQQEQFSFSALTESNGLSESTNAFVFRDSRGFVWVSSIDGLNRFDGRRVRVFRPDPNKPHSIYDKNIQSPFFEDHEGNLWFTTEKSISCYRRQTGRFEHFYVGTGGYSSKDKVHYAFHLDANEFLWVVASDSLFKFDTRHPRSLSASKSIAYLPKAVRCALNQSDAGIKHLFVAFWANGPGFEVLTFDTSDKLIGRNTYFDKTKKVCLKVVCDKSGLAWFATNEGLLGFDIAQPGRRFDCSLPHEKGLVCSVSLLDDEHLLTVSTLGEIWSFNTKDLFYEQLGGVYTTEEGLKKQVLVRGVTVTKDQLAWLSLKGEGLFFSGLSRHRYARSIGESPSSSTWSFSQVFESKTGLIWCIDSKGAAYVFGTNTRFVKKQPSPELSVLFDNSKGKTQLLSPKLMLGVGGATILPEEKGGYALGLPQITSHVVQLSSGTYLVGTAGGLYSIAETNGATNAMPFFRELVTALFKDRNNLIWVGSQDRLDVFEIAGDDSARRVAFLDHTGMVNQIAADLLDPFAVWVGTTNGAIRINTQNWKDERLGERDGLASAYIQSLVPDSKGRIWLGTNKGIARYQPHAAAQDRVRFFNRQNGLSSNEYCRGAALLTSNGYVWFAGKKGIDVFHPDSMQDIGAAPQLAIVGLKIHDQEWQDSTTCIEMAERIELEHNENTLRLELAAMEYTDPEMNKFRVRLLNNGNDTSWIDLGTQNFITYANLRPGTYRFEFTACNSEGVWQETPRRLVIIIHPHYSQTGWFRALIAALALAAIGFSTSFYYRYRLRLQQLALEKQQREAERKQLLFENEISLQEERNRIADEMHDELGGGLSTIRLASQRAKKVESPEELQGILKRVSQISIGLVNNMRGIIWAMDSQNDSLRSLLAYIRQYAGTFLDDNGIAATLSMPSEVPDHVLSSQYRHNVMLTVKECLNNILKHAEATKVELLVNLESQLLISIQDNGKGFEPTEHAGMGKGLRTTVKRMESVGGSIEWRRNDTGGMTVVLLAPLP